MEAYMGDNEVIIQVGNSRTLTIVSTETTDATPIDYFLPGCTHYITIAVVHILYCCFTEMHLCPILVLVDVIVKARFVSDT